MKDLCIEDNYLKEFDAVVESVKDDKFIALNQTAFYPNAGGQPFDTGTMKTEDGKEYEVVFVGKFDNKISHEVDNKENPPLNENDKVHCAIDWERRYMLMRMHTAAHILSRVLHQKTGAVTSGNQLGIDRSRIDFTLDDFDREKILECVKISNEIIAKKIPVKKSFITREEAFKLPGFAKVSPHLVKGFDTLRVVDIENVDTQPCGGTHLNNIEEIGKIEFVKAENKGKNNRRVYYTVKE